MPDVAPLLIESDEALNDYRNRALNLLCLSVLSGLPQVSIPLASRLEAPLGLSIMGPAGSDLSLVSLARRIADGAAS
jgi:amidase